MDTYKAKKLQRIYGWLRAAVVVLFLLFAVIGLLTAYGII